ncbi:hypothetical protein [Spirosoma fluviale]|uniref:PIN domain-containing protein n=1 Tax=Spirosoma fluviale TaxID=1597977 RepID=A0A286FEM7_9BACT|nr:hypothetical protein [Spirosoma fluviale]SOD81681.1 hypothetical protein SAMN06269250_1874 [Spirosoma fluviale]
MTVSSPTSFVLVDTGVMSRFFLKKPQIVKAYTELVVTAVPVISASVYIELMRWLVNIRGRAIDPITKSEFDAIRKQLDKYVQLNHGDCIELAVETCRLYPDTGLGDCFTIGVGLFLTYLFLRSIRSTLNACQESDFIGLTTLTFWKPINR